jgi:hypothetical protein
MKTTRPYKESYLRKLFAKIRPSRPKRRLPHPRRTLAPIAGAVFVSLIIGAAAGHFLSPVFLVNTGDFIWSIKSSLAELALVVVAARVPKRH